MVGEEERVGVLVGVCVCVVGFIMVDVEQLIIILINCEHNLSNFQFQFQKRKLNASTVLFVHSTELTYNIE